MTHIVHCHEAQGLPMRQSLAHEANEALAVYLLEDNPDRGASARATILRRADALAPADAHLLFEAELGQSGRFRVLRVTRIGRIPVDLFRTEGRSRVVIGSEIRSGGRLEVDPTDREAVSFTLSLAAQSAQGLRGTVGAGGTRSSQAAGAHATLLWLVPSVIQLIRDPLDDVKDGVVEWGSRSGINPRAFTALLSVTFTLLATGGFGVSQYFAAQEAEAALAVAEASAGEAEASTAAALDAEAACIVDRRKLAASANQRDEERRLLVEGSLARAQSRVIAEGKGGRRFGTDAVQPFDADAWSGDVRAVLAQLDAAAPTVEPGARCRAFTLPLERDLPAYVLSSHPDATQACPVAYLTFASGTSLRGSWGLSDRALLELAGPARVAEDAAVDGFDARDVDRSAAAMLGAGVRAVRGSLLSVDVGPRATVAPSELNLWSLALFDAANRLPSRSAGAPEQTMADCVGALVKARAAETTTAAPGEPVLPSVAAVASGSVVLSPVPTAACAWPEGVIAKGAATALRAAARAAAVPPPAAAE